MFGWLDFSLYSTLYPANETSIIILICLASFPIFIYRTHNTTHFTHKQAVHKCFILWPLCLCKIHCPLIEKTCGRPCRCLPFLNMSKRVMFKRLSVLSIRYYRCVLRDLLNGLLCVVCMNLLFANWIERVLSRYT